ncbi:hAT transposon family protein, partial [Staphylococcus aureus]|nr:hAT transposon family protein [Staphylococcus aureus]
MRWWRKNGSQIPAWARAAQIVFAMTPISAGCERVFALLRHCVTCRFLWRCPAL